MVSSHNEKIIKESNSIEQEELEKVSSLVRDIC